MATTKLILPDKLSTPVNMQTAFVQGASKALALAALQAWLADANNKYFGLLCAPIPNNEGGVFYYDLCYYDYTPIDTPITRLEANTLLSSPAAFSSGTNSGGNVQA